MSVSRTTLPSFKSCHALFDANFNFNFKHYVCTPSFQATLAKQSSTPSFLSAEAKMANPPCSYPREKWCSGLLIPCIVAKTFMAKMQMSSGLRDGIS